MSWLICPGRRTGGRRRDPRSATAAARAIAEVLRKSRARRRLRRRRPSWISSWAPPREGASLYAVTDPAGITHRVWEVKREDAVAAIRAMLDQAPEPAPADDPHLCRRADRGGAALARDEARTAGTYTGKVAVQLYRCCVIPAAQVAGGAPQASDRVCSPTRLHGSNRV